MDERIRAIDERVFGNALRSKLSAALSKTRPSTPEQIDVRVYERSRLRSSARLHVIERAGAVVYVIEIPAGARQAERDILIPLLCQAASEEHAIPAYQAAYDRSAPVGVGRATEDAAKGAPALAHAVFTFDASDDAIRNRQRSIHDEILRQSQRLREANFTSIQVRDLALLFAAYDQHFFDCLCRQAIGDSRLKFRLSTRMTIAGGKTTRRRSAAGDTHYEIAISCGLLFDGFKDADRSITVCGQECVSRLDALQRIFEHELVHLIEYVCWGDSDCSKTRFQTIATRHFLHSAHTHQLITRRERAAQAGVRPGARVTFIFEGRMYTGVVNRITRRATVLVEDPHGTPYSDGRRYQTYYVPIELLTLADAARAK